MHKGPVLLAWIHFNQAWTSNDIHYKVWDEITYQFQTSTIAPLKFGDG